MGVQIVHTQQSSDSNAFITAAVPIHDGTNYNDVLPSLNLVFGFPSGQKLRLEWLQDATGGRALPSTANMTNFRLGASGTSLTATANKRDIWTMMWDATDAVWFEISRVQNL